MAIQLNDRDQLIFQLIEEHQVLLEKHIAWFISGDDKPVLIRDRLRKLFYLDYLLCHRHASKLPWWTTPTKPLVYMLSPMARTVAAMPQTDVDLMDSEFQRHHLEVANLRMLYLVAKNAGQIRDFAWQTIKADQIEDLKLDAIVTYCIQDTVKVGLVNNPSNDAQTLSRIEKSCISHGLDSILIASRDESAQKKMQAAIHAKGGLLDQKAFFATHQELYKEGIVITQWQNSDPASLGQKVTQSVSPVAYIQQNLQIPPIAV